jgi:hypothetical protein
MRSLARTTDVLDAGHLALDTATDDHAVLVGRYSASALRSQE